ncbi:Metallo-dependent phosphatase-like protein [Radiomyces spectabilis]|uniref:Metallo-dependent phosphatase-like protein n=1 Tax=Radiomyces spectabilis TaxID=64574 RepID=UPI00221F0B64|nr:Metallo-dependent phosphatase-like protein [Radiomyces spectabilis]KAI8393891.1 Metallo-dependent phosphatase-like protein [Radiomyces spectabilis]
MAITKSSLTCILLTVLCILRAWQLDQDSTAAFRPTHSYSSLPEQATNNTTTIHDSSAPLDESPSNLFYFIQVSDLHISKFHKEGHTNHFLHFLQSVLPITSPEFVVVTGDLTDAKDVDMIKTQQYLEEWEIYKTAVEESASSLPWYDMRGNHDCFNLPSWKSNQNLYRTHGKSAYRLEGNNGVYRWNVKKPYGTYQFVAMDACPKFGPARPFNFYGYLTTPSLDDLESAVTSSQNNHTFLFAHYPTTTMVYGVSSQGQSLRDLARSYSIYFCGHLHRLVGGLGDVLKSYDSASGTLELELADLKDHGAYRIVAVDHDIVSFVDLELPLSQLTPSDPVPLTKEKKIQWPEKIQLAPVVLITNPKDARFAMPHKEPLSRIQSSSHIRFLVFSYADPVDLQVTVSIDGKTHPFPASFTGNMMDGQKRLPLWTSPWDPNDFDDLETHTLRIQVRAPDGQMGESTIHFRTDSQRIDIKGGFGEWVIGTHMSVVFKCMTLMGLTVMIVLLLAPKLYAETLSDGGAWILLKLHQIDGDPLAGPYAPIYRQIYVWMYRLVRLPEQWPQLWYTSFMIVLALTSLPWFRAELIPSAATTEERFGMFYIWGFMFSGEWIPLADTWMYATFHVCYDVGVFFLLFAWRASHSTELHCRGSQKAQQLSRQLNERGWFKGLEVIYWLWRVSKLLSMGSFYGGVWPVLIINLLTFWLVFVGYVLFFGPSGVFTSAKHHFTRIDLLNDCSGCKQEQLYQSGGEDHHEEFPTSSSTSSLSNGSPNINTRRRN